MAYLLLALALLAAAAGVALWYLDARQRAAAATGEGAPNAVDVEPPEPAADPAADPAEADQASDDSAPAPPTPSVDPPAAEAEPAPEPLAPARPVMAAPPAHEPHPEPEPKAATPTPEGDSAPEPEPESEPETEPEAEPAAKQALKTTASSRASGLQLPGATRRERKSWAEEHGFTFTRTDEYLVDEWSRGAAATGAPARDIVIGDAFGHELLLMDLGGINVMAMRTGAASDTVVDFRREDLSADTVGEGDLVLVDQVEGFNVYGTMANTTRRFLDSRVRTALGAFPEIVTAVWLESDWVLAQTVRGTKAEDWDEMLAPLALIADAARVLPPRGGTEPELKIADFTPSRHMEPLPVDASFGGGVDVDQRPEGPDPSSAPPVSRPDEPLELPSRSRPQARGVVEPRSLGGDEVDAIADGRGPSASDPTRMPRRQDRGPSIFGD